MRSRRSLHTFLSGLVYSAVTMVVGIVSVPLLLRWLGEARFGAFRAALDWFGYVSLLELGVGGALLPLIAGAVGRGDPAEVRDALSAGIRAHVRIGVLMLVGGLALAAVIPWLVPVESPLRGDLVCGVLLATVGLLAVPLNPFRALVEARQRGALVNALLIGQSLLSTGAALGLAWAGAGISGQFAASTFAGLAFAGFLTLLELRRDRSLVDALKASPSEEARRRLWSLNLPTLIRQTCGRVGVLSDRILVAALLGPAAVVPLYVTQRLPELAQSQLQGIGVATWAPLAELHARGDATTFNTRLVQLTHLTAALGCAVLVPITAYNGHFLSLWVGAEHAAGPWVTAFAAASALFLSIIMVWEWALGCTGRVALLVPVTLCFTVLKLVLAVPLTFLLGLVGPLLGTVAAAACTRLWYVPRLLKRAFGASAWRLTRAWLAPVAMGLPIALLLGWFASGQASIGWLSLAAQMSAGGLLYLALWWMLVLPASERAEHIARLRSLGGSR